MQKRLSILIAMLGLIAGSSGAFAQCSDLFFSEYIEGSGSNKALEIYNPLDVSVDLTDYVVYRFNGGATSASDS
ncbi:MAG: hypothetical protein D6722_10510, partial [Bacteroidetes bacterium]